MSFRVRDGVRCVAWGVFLLLFLVNIGKVEGRARDYLKKEDGWFKSKEGQERLRNVLSWQAANGSWPKNMDTTGRRYDGGRGKLRGTFDNGATVWELRLLARAYGVTGDGRVKAAFMTGVKGILGAQYENGGWPQSIGARGYGLHITFNDGVMVGLMTFLREVSERKAYDFVGKKIRGDSAEAFEKGVECILNCQIKVKGKLAVWCAQHDRKTLAVRGARSYEHPSLSGGESAGVVLLLMSLDKPSMEIRTAIRAAVAWYKGARIEGIKVVTRGGERKVVREKRAGVLWARFYEIETGRPIFSGRDGVIKYRFEEIEAERRNGYAWYVNSGKKVSREWEKWKKKWE